MRGHYGPFDGRRHFFARGAQITSRGAAAPRDAGPCPGGGGAVPCSAARVLSPREVLEMRSAAAVVLGGASLFVMAAAPLRAQGVVIDADFSSGALGFVYEDDVFRGTRAPDYAHGEWVLQKD